MGRNHRKMLISSISALIIFLLVISATNTVADVDWGNLKVGDEMRWHWTPGFAHTAVRDSYYELEILEIGGESLRVDHHRYNLIGTYFEEYTLKSGHTNLDPDDLIYEFDDIQELSTKLYWIYPVSLMRENKDIKTRTYNFDGNNHKAAYIKEEDSSGIQHEFWWDYNTGILFEYDSDYRTASIIGIDLEYTNADLTDPPRRLFCIGSMLVAFVPVTMLISYSIVRYYKKEKT